MNFSLRALPTTTPEMMNAAEHFMKALSGSPIELQKTSDANAQRDGGILATIAVVLAVPGAITAILELKRQLGSTSERRALRERIEPPLTQLSSQKALVLDLGGQSINLGSATVDDVLDALARVEVSDPKDDK